jgi:hypothetical protein
MGIEAFGWTGLALHNAVGGLSSERASAFQRKRESSSYPGNLDSRFRWNDKGFVELEDLSRDKYL